MIFIALLCLIMIWPLGKIISRKYGYSFALYVLGALACWMLMSTIFMMLTVYRQDFVYLAIFPFVSVGLNHILFILVGEMKRSGEISQKKQLVMAIEDEHESVTDQISDNMADWIPFKTYSELHQQHQYLKDRELLERDKVRFFVDQSIIVTIFIHPDDVLHADSIIQTES